MGEVKEMESKEFSKYSVYHYDLQQEGETLYIKGASFLPEEVDYTDENSIIILATKAVNTADGLYDLIKCNYNTNDPDISAKSHLEMFLSLAGLTCEIYLKSIIYYENKHNGKKNTEHNLSQLFKNIPKEHKDTIKQIIPNIDEILPSIGNVFKSFRYDFEINSIQGEYLYLFDFMEKLRTICKSYPSYNVGEIRYANGIMSIE